MYSMHTGHFRSLNTDSSRARDKTSISRTKVYMFQYAVNKNLTSSMVITECCTFLTSGHMVYVGLGEEV
jgi:hypothetical protein